MKGLNPEETKVVKEFLENEIEEARKKAEEAGKVIAHWQEPDRKPPSQSKINKMLKESSHYTALANGLEKILGGIKNEND